MPPAGKLLEKNARLLALEKGAVRKEPGGRLNLCLAYPNTYYVGMSNLGFQGVYSLLNAYPDVLCERVFLPDEEDLPEYVRTGTELFSMESARPLAAFDAISFSVSFENDYPNIVKILELAGIPPRARERGPRDPLVFMGGITAFSNPEPVAEFFDAVLIGDAEAVLPPFIGLLRQKKSAGRTDFLKSALSLPGLYAPGFYEVEYEEDGKIKKRVPPTRVRKVYVKEGADFRMRQQIITPETEFSGMRLIELMRGCPWDCAFCLAGEVYNPPRVKPAEMVRAEIKEALAEGGRVGLVGPSVSDYAGVAELLSMQEVEFSITSLRAGSRSIGLIPLLKRHRSLSIAAEAGSERLRKLINKKITEEDILLTSRAILEAGINLRLYLMVGLPAETDEDIKALIELVGKVREGRPGGKITLTISVFVPKPATRFERARMERPAVVKERLKFIKKELKPLPGVGVFHDVPKYAYMQGVLSMGDRRLTPAIEKMAGGTDYRTALGESGLEEDFYIFREKGAEEILPWGFIEC